MKLIFLTFTLFIFSCVKQNQYLTIEDFKKMTKAKWIFAEEVSEIKFDGEVKRPLGFPIQLLKIKYLNGQSDGLETDCLYYKVPYKKDLGQIYLINLKNINECPELPSDENKIVENVKLLKIYFKNFHLILDIDGKNLDIPFYNLKKIGTHEKLKHETENKILNGFRLINTSEEFSSKNIYIGNYNQRFSLNTAIQCRKVNSQCEIVGEDKCQFCKFGYYSVIDYECPNGGSRFCGVNHCGEKGEPACSRGTITKADDNDAICNDGLVPARDKNNILVCQ